MWAPLRHQRHLEHYRDLHEQSRDQGEDWRPMIRAVEHCREQAYAFRLFAFTSQSRFCVTTARSSDQAAGHLLVTLEWVPAEGQFRLRMEELKDPKWSQRKQCSERDLPNLLDEWIEGLLLK